MCVLAVYYDLKRDASGELVFRDDEIEEIAGVEIVAAGCGMCCSARDVELHFDDEESRDAARFALSEAGFRFDAECDIHPI